MRYDIMTVFLMQVPTCNRVSHAAWNTQRTIWRLISLFSLRLALLMHISLCISLSPWFFSIHTTDFLFPSFPFKFGTRSENSTTGKTVLKCLQSLLHNSFFCLHVLRCLKGLLRTLRKNNLKAFGNLAWEKFYYKSHGAFLWIYRFSTSFLQGKMCLYTS